MYTELMELQLTIKGKEFLVIADVEKIPADAYSKMQVAADIHEVFVDSEMGWLPYTPSKREFEIFEDAIALEVSE